MEYNMELDLHFVIPYYYIYQYLVGSLFGLLVSFQFVVVVVLVFSVGGFL